MTEFAHYNDDEKELLSIVFNWRWISRICVIQEVALVRDADVALGPIIAPWKTMVLCVDFRILSEKGRAPWDTAAENLKRMEKGPVPRSSIVVEVSEFVSGRHTRGGPQKPLREWQGSEDGEKETALIFALILDATRSHCSEDPRDNVFGLLGVIRKAARIRKLPDCPIKADYRKKVAQVS